ncbi:MAG: DUF4411 family protein [Lachnospiraceae bacterium]|nr:DUF4411 family protein [Ruminococcus sp.]MCM1276688.1 DUF4411 family protein [Lachnospiraceae bacterium]
MSKEIFLVDTNSFIEPKKGYYAFDLAPGFWTQFTKHIKSKEIAVLDMVKDEIGKGTDELSRWVKSIDIPELVSRRDSAIIGKYGEIINDIAQNPYYKPSALTEWSRDTVADAWLIAAAAVKGYTLITLEQPAKSLNLQNPSKNAKIPDVAARFKVKTNDLFYMMRELKFILK